MKNPLLALLAVAALTSCSNLSDYDDDRQSDVKNEYTKPWIHTCPVSVEAVLTGDSTPGIYIISGRKVIIR